MNEAAKYEVVGDASIVVLHGVIYNRGAEVEFNGWPTPALRPLNESARKIAAYRNGRVGDHFMPSSPWNAALRRFFLPAQTQIFVPERHDTPDFALPGLEPDDAPPTMPRFRAREPLKFKGGATVEAGQTFCCSAWPAYMNATPVNEAAKRVVDYWRDCAGSPEFSSPWCRLAEEVVLPEVVKRKRAADKAVA